MKNKLNPYRIIKDNNDNFYHFNEQKLLLTQVDEIHIQLLQQISNNECIDIDNFSQEEKQHLYDLHQNEMFCDIKTETANLNNIEPRAFRIVLTETCNLACAECFATKNKQCLKTMNKETLFRLLDYSFQFGKDKQLTYCFFGGEPLIKFDLIKEAVNKIETAVEENLIQCPLYTITTNGTILTEEIIRFFNKYKFRVGMSIDGPKELHDKLRPYRNGNGSFDDAIRNYKKLVDAGVNMHVLITPNPDHLTELIDIVEYVLKNFPMTELTINTPFKYDTLQWSVDGEEYAKILFEIMHLAKKYNVIIDSALSAILGSITNGIRRSTPCSILGNEFMSMVSPQGELSICAQKYNNKIAFKKEYEYHKEDACKNCGCLGFCGGVCPAFRSLSGITYDKNKCKFMHSILNLLVNNLDLFEED